MQKTKENDPKTITYSCKISKRQEQKMQFYINLGIKKSIFGFLGVESIIKMFDELFKDFGNDAEKFRDKIKNPPSLYGYSYLVKELPLEEKIKLELLNNGKNERRLK